MKNILGDRIKKLRENANMSQKDLSKLLSVERNTLSQYESGTRTPSDTVKIKICDIFNVDLDYLVGRDIKKLIKEHDQIIDLKEIIETCDISYSKFRFNDNQKQSLLDLLDVFVEIHRKNT